MKEPIFFSWRFLRRSSILWCEAEANVIVIFPFLDVESDDDDHDGVGGGGGGYGFEADDNDSVGESLQSELSPPYIPTSPTPVMYLRSAHKRMETPDTVGRKQDLPPSVGMSKNMCEPYFRANVLWDGYTQGALSDLCSQKVSAKSINDIVLSLLV